MNRFIVCLAACFVVLALTGHVQAFGGHGGGHGGRGGHFGGRSFQGGHFGHFGNVPHGGIFRHPSGSPHGFGRGGFFPPRRGFGGSGFFAPFAFRAGPPVAIIKDPFFCFPHGLGFTAQDAFFAHLRDLHGVSPGYASFSLIQTGGRLIFLDF